MQNVWRKRNWKNIGKTFESNVAVFLRKINQHISECKTGASTCIFPWYVFSCERSDICMKVMFFNYTFCDSLKWQSARRISHHSKVILNFSGFDRRTCSLSKMIGNIIFSVIKMWNLVNPKRYWLSLSQCHLLINMHNKQRKRKLHRKNRWK